MVRAVAAAFAMLSLGTGAHAHSECGTGQPAHNEKVPMRDLKRHVEAVFGGEGDRRLHNRRLGMSHNSTVRHRTLQTVSAVIPVICHGVRDSNCQCEGNDCFTRDDCEGEVNHLNNEYNMHGIEFVMTALQGGFIETCDTDFFGLFGYSDDGGETSNTNYEGEIETYLAGHGISMNHYLNLFYVNVIQYSLYGFATFPPGMGGSSIFQGVVNDYQTCGTCGPNGSKGQVCASGCEGDTNVHEVGHFFGLQHTFDDGCSLTGDFVSDTPSTSEAHYGCPSGIDPNDPEGTGQCLNSCGDNDGCDMIYNFMDYSDDYCLTAFTEEQGYKMLYNLAVHRPDLVSGWSTVEGDESANCIPGSYFDGTACAKCPTGTYNDMYGCNGPDCCVSCPQHSSLLRAWADDNEGAANVYECFPNNCYACPSETDARRKMADHQKDKPGKARRELLFSRMGSSPPTPSPSTAYPTPSPSSAYPTPSPPTASPTDSPTDSTDPSSPTASPPTLSPTATSTDSPTDSLTDSSSPTASPPTLSPTPSPTLPPVDDESTTAPDPNAPCVVCEQPISGVARDVTLEFTTDKFSEESSVQFCDGPVGEGIPDPHCWETVAQGSQAKETTETYTYTLPADTVVYFHVRDSYGDGICCLNGHGAWRLTDSTGTLLSESTVEDPKSFTYVYTLTFITQA